ncbi:hypothetical protein JCM10207_009202 [Rhodosporidiobolus poonsookiae]
MATASSSKWTLDYTSASPSKVDIRDPPGFVPALSSKAAAKSTKPANVNNNLDSLRQQKAWELALAPAKNVPMQAFMMYMSGSGIQIFSVMSVWFLLKQAIGGVMGVEKVFAPFSAASKAKAPAPDAAPASFFQQKVIYVLCQLALLGVGLWKINSMGLLPRSEADFAPYRSFPIPAPPVRVDLSGLPARLVYPAMQYLG